MRKASFLIRMVANSSSIFCSRMIEKRGETAVLRFRNVDFRNAMDGHHLRSIALKTLIFRRFVMVRPDCSENLLMAVKRRKRRKTR